MTSPFNQAAVEDAARPLYASEAFQRAFVRGAKWGTRQTYDIVEEKVRAEVSLVRQEDAQHFQLLIAEAVIREGELVKALDKATVRVNDMDTQFAVAFEALEEIAEQPNHLGAESDCADENHKTCWRIAEKALAALGKGRA